MAAHSARLAVYLVPSLLLLLAAGGVGVVTNVVSTLRGVRPVWPIAWASVGVAIGLLVALAGSTTMTGIGKFARPDENNRRCTCRTSRPRASC